MAARETVPVSPSAPPARSARGRRRLKRAAWAGGVVAALGALGWFVGPRFVPLPAALLAPPDDTLVLEDRAGREIAVVASRRARVAEWTTLAEAGAWLPRVTVALEDRRFWEHDGAELRSFAAAAWRNVRAGRIVSGGSTIPQQLVKNTRERSGWRWFDKVHEALAARRLARAWPRERILEEYLNRIDYGNRRLGPRAAARAYFGKEPADLTVAEAVFLAGLPQSPTRYNPWRRPEAAAERYRRSLRALGEAGVLDAAQLAALGGEPPPVIRRAPPHVAPQFAEAVVAAHPGARGRVRTTLDLALQEEVAGLAAAHVSRLRARGVTQAAVVVLDADDGAVRAYVGAADFAGPGGALDGVQSPRSAGSVLKPFLYAEAIERRVLTAASVLPDTPDAIRAEYVDYDPRNFDLQWLGPVRVREALGSSLNVPAVWALSRVGAPRFFARLQDWGFAFPRDLRAYGAGVVLGHAEPRLIDVAAAFGGLTHGGRVPRSRLLEGEPKTARVVADAGACAIVTDILCDDDARRRAFGRGSPLAAPGRVPVKTGTSAAFRDAWTVGATARHVVAVWAGNFDGAPMDGAASIEAAAPLWRAIVDRLLAADGGVAAPVEGDDRRLVARDVCRLSGLVPVAASPGTVREWFLAGTEPRESAAAWLRPQAEGGVALVLPAAFRAWCASPHNFLGARVADEPGGALAIRVPADGAVFTLVPDLARAQQQLVLECDAPAEVDVAWLVDGRPVARRGRLALWPLEPGEHTATARTPDGRSATTRFRVNAAD